jgi:hypothetical protein
VVEGLAKEINHCHHFTWVTKKANLLTHLNSLLITVKIAGMSLGRQLLVADYNNDNILDFYVADHGVGTHDGVRDSYFLSQPNGTWVESSKHI